MLFYPVDFVCPITAVSWIDKQSISYIVYWKSISLGYFWYNYCTWVPTENQYHIQLGGEVNKGIIYKALVNLQAICDGLEQIL